MKRKTMFLWVLAMPFLLKAAALQTVPATQRDSSVLVIDGIRFEAVTFRIDSATRVATAEFNLTNLTEKPRELKINVYGTQLVDNGRNAYYFSTITMGRVLMRFSDKQNYLHYFLQPDVPVKLTITADDIPATAAAMEVVRIVFEDGKEEGRFLDAYLTAPAPAVD